MCQTSRRFTPSNCHPLTPATFGCLGPWARDPIFCCRSKERVDFLPPDPLEESVFTSWDLMSSQVLWGLRRHRCGKHLSFLVETHGATSTPRAHCRIAPRDSLCDSGVTWDRPEPLVPGLLQGVGARTHGLAPLCPPNHKAAAAAYAPEVLRCAPRPSGAPLALSVSQLHLTHASQCPGNPLPMMISFYRTAD